MKHIDSIILLDECSKQVIKTNISAFSARNVCIITSLNEMSAALLEECKKVIIFENFLQSPTAFSDLRLYKAVFDLDYYYLYSSKEWLDVMQGYAVCFCCDVSTVSYETIQAALFRDDMLEGNKDAAQDKELTKMLAEDVLRNQANVDYTAVTLAQHLLSTLKREDILLDEKNRAQEMIHTLSAQNAFLHKNSSLLVQSYSDLIHEADKQNRCMKQYEIAFSKDVYDKINVHNYNDRPFIIYVKEYEELLGLNLFINTLADVFRIQNRQSVKVLRLYDKSSCRRIATIPPYYKVITSKYYSRDITANDYLCKTGDYHRILDTLLLNRTYLDVLIIVDCKDLNDTVLTGSMLQLNLCRNKEHLQCLGLHAENTIVNADESMNPDLLCWDKYDLGNLDKDDKFLFLSARPVIQRVLQLSRLFNQAV